MITQELVRKLFDYNPETGILKYKTNSKNHKNKGRAVSSVGKRGYLQASICGKKVYVHRIAFLHYHGYLPEFIDHKKANKLDNRIDSLRPATQSENNFNKEKPCNNTSGHKNVCWNKSTKKWKVSIQKDGKQNHIGLFEDKNDAIDSARKARELFFGEFANHG